MEAIRRIIDLVEERLGIKPQTEEEIRRMLEEKYNVKFEKAWQRGGFVIYVAEINDAEINRRLQRIMCVAVARLNRYADGSPVAYVALFVAPRPLRITDIFGDYDDPKNPIVYGDRDYEWLFVNIEDGEHGNYRWWFGLLFTHVALY